MRQGEHLQERGQKPTTGSGQWGRRGERPLVDTRCGGLGKRGDSDESQVSGWGGR